jgi:hypothetical protein
MNVRDYFAYEYKEYINWSYSCIDRIVINGMFNMAQTPGGFRYWWRDLFGDDSDLTNEKLRTLAGDFSRRVTYWTKKNGVPLIYCRGNVRKSDVSDEYTEAARESGTKGVYLVISGNAPAPVWKVDMTLTGKIKNIHREKPYPFVKHYYFHIMDEDWGHVIVKVCGYAPYGVQVILNGHEWVQCGLQRKESEFICDGNCFADGDAHLIQRLSERMIQPGFEKKLEEVCERWVYGVVTPFAMRDEVRLRTRFAYDWRLFQLEYSRDYIFHSGRTMEEIFQAVIDRNRSRLSLKDVKTIFGARGRPHQRNRTAEEPGGRRGTVSKEVDQKSYNLTVMKLHWKLSSLKIYDKSARLLRFESVEHNLRKTKKRGRLENWFDFVSESCRKLERFTNSLVLLDNGLVDRGRFEYWGHPSSKGKKRLAGIRFDDVRMRTVVESLIRTSLLTEGITRAELAKEVNSRGVKCDVRKVGYDMSKLRGKGVLEKIPGSRRNRIDLRKLRALTTILQIRENVLKPLHAASTSKPQKKKYPLSPEDKQYKVIRKEFNQLFRIINLKACIN